MRARDVMTREVVSVTPDTAVLEAARRMLESRVSGVPVLDGGRVVGMITEGDLMRRAELMTERRPWWLSLASSPEQQAKAYAKAHALRVRDVMTTRVVALDEHDPLDRIAMIFEENGIKRAPVIKDGKLIGIVSRANLLQGLAMNKLSDTGPSDREIKSKIIETARDEAAVRAPLVDITVKDGVVHLWGNVASEEERNAVRVVAENTDGVRQVEDHLRVFSPTSVERTFE